MEFIDINKLINPISGENIYFFVDKKLVGTGNTEYNGRAYFIFHDTSEEAEYKVEAVFKGQNDNENSKYAWCDKEASLIISTNVQDQGNQESELPEETQTPGFELILIIFAIGLLLFWKRKSNKS